MSTITDAVTESRNYDKIVTIDVADMQEALDEIRADAADDDEVDYVETYDADDNRMLDVWGYDPDADDDSMTFRVYLRYSPKLALAEAIATICDCYERDRANELVAQARDNEESAIALAKVLRAEVDDNGELRNGAVSQRRITSAESDLLGE